MLIKQDLEEAKQNVAKRLELIEREMYADFNASACVLRFNHHHVVLYDVVGRNKRLKNVVVSLV